MQSLIHFGLTVALFSGPAALAQPRNGMPRYDPSTETRVTGTSRMWSSLKTDAAGTESTFFMSFVCQRDLKLRRSAAADI